MLKRNVDHFTLISSTIHVLSGLLACVVGGRVVYMSHRCRAGCGGVESSGIAEDETDRGTLPSIFQVGRRSSKVLVREVEESASSRVVKSNGG